MKRYLCCFLSISLLISVFASVASAQNSGVDYFLTDQFDEAEDIFKTQLAKNPAESNYYLGEIAYKKGRTALAKSYFEKGLEADPNYMLNKVGVTKFLLKDDPKAGEKELSNIAKISKKDATVLIAIARAYYENGMKDKAEKMVSSAEKAGRNSPLVPMLRGDIAKKAEDVGVAAGEYEQAINYDPNYFVPYIKVAQIYVDINPAFALEKLNDVIEKFPDYPLAKRYLARAYYNIGQYNRAIDIYKSYFDINISAMHDLTDYAASLFFAQRYEEATEMIEKGVKKDSDNFVLNRLRMYTAVERQDYVNGLAIAEKFFSLPKDENKYIARDNAAFAELLSNSGKIDDAISQYEFMLEQSPDKRDAYKQIGEKLNKANYPGLGADYYEKYIATFDEGQVDAKDYFTLGQYLYKAATLGAKDTLDTEMPAKIETYLVKADTAFGSVIQLIPDNNLGFIFRARVNALRDPDAANGLAKPYYEGSLNIILAKEDPKKTNRRELLEIYRYISYYYYVKFEANAQKEDKEQAIAYSQKMLELDPTNGVATQLMEALTKK